MDMMIMLQQIDVEEIDDFEFCFCVEFILFISCLFCIWSVFSFKKPSLNIDFTVLVFVFFIFLLELLLSEEDEFIFSKFDFGKELLRHLG